MKLRAINMIRNHFCRIEMNSILSVLPFIHAHVIDCAGNRVLVSCLVDSGASISILSKKWIETNNLLFKPIEYRAKLVGFGGSTSSSNLKGE